MKKKIIIAIIIVILLIILFFVIRTINNSKIFKQIENAIANFTDSGNYSYQVVCSNEMKNSTKQVYNNTKIKLEIGNAVYYGDIETGEVYAVNLENNTYNKLNTSSFPQILPKTFINPPALFSTLLSKVNDTENNYLLMLITSSISNDNYNGVECYKISVLGTETVWISKVTLLPVKNESNNEEYIYSFEASNVMESDVILENIEELTEETN